MSASQAEWIAAAIVAGFLLFLAIKGKLGDYWRLLTGGGKAAAPVSAAPAGGAAGAAAAGAATLATGAAGAAGAAAAGAATAGSSGNIMPDWMPSISPLPGFLPGFRF